MGDSDKAESGWTLGSHSNAIENSPEYVSRCWRNSRNYDLNAN